MSEANKETVLRAYAELWSKGDAGTIERYYTPDYVWHGPGGGDVEGREALGQMVSAFKTALPDFSLENNHLVAEGDMVASRWVATGTHKGDLMGIAPTGKSVKITAMMITRFAGGKIAEEWEDFDQYLLMQQLGAIPSGS